MMKNSLTTLVVAGIAGVAGLAAMSPPAPTKYEIRMLQMRTLDEKRQRRSDRPRWRRP